MKKILVVLLFLGLYLASSTASYLYFTLSRVKVAEPLSPIPGQSAERFDLSPIPIPVSPAAYHVLLLGYGGADHAGGALTDAMLVVRIDPEQKRVVLISVPRDIWITLPLGNNAKGDRKINNAYVLGGGELAKQAVSTVVGLPIQYVVAVGFDGFKEAIDILGGVEVDVPVTFDDYYFPVVGKENESCGRSPEEVEEILTTLSGFEIDKQFPCRFEHIHFDAGKQLMNGETVLQFVRSRHSAQHGGDFARSQRQHALLLGMKDALLSVGALDDVIPFFNQLSHTIKTDIDEGVVKAVLKAVGDESAYTYSTTQLTEQNVLTLTTSKDGPSILVPKEGVGKWRGIHAFVAEQIGIAL